MNANSQQQTGRPLGTTSSSPTDRLPIVGRYFPTPAAVKVPEIILLFWVVKILTTAGGEVTSDYLKKYGNFGGGGTEVLLFAIALVWQFSTRRYRAFAYWSLAYAIAIAGTGLSDFLHLDVHIPYLGTTILWAVILAAVFAAWYRSEGTLSIHSISTQRREGFYWATVFATFALGTALGDFTATSLNMGYLVSGPVLPWTVPDPRDRLVEVRAEQCPGVLDRLRADATARRIVRRLDQQAGRPHRTRLRQRANRARHRRDRVLPGAVPRGRPPGRTPRARALATRRSRR